MREVIQLKKWLFHNGDYDFGSPTDKNYYYMSAKTEGCRKGPAYSGFYADEDPLSENKERTFDGWKYVQVPHDYLADAPIDPEQANTLGMVKCTNAWYIYDFDLSAEDMDKRISLFFEGIAVHAKVYLNSCFLKHSTTAYVPFEVDITDFVNLGSNHLAVYCDTSPSEGWWYQGGGIYRPAYLIKTSPIHTDLYGVYMKPEKSDEDLWNTQTTVTVCNDSYAPAEVTAEVVLKIKDGAEIARKESTVHIDASSKQDVQLSLFVKNPSLWSPDHPSLYTATVSLYADGALLDSTDTTYGYREFSIDPDKGLFINGKHFPIHGVCAHQNGGRLFGHVLPDNINRYRLEQLKAIGINAYRTGHYMQSPATMELLDSIGFIVMDETRQFSTSEDSLEQLQALVKRDRNHPCVFFWSTGNEDPLTCTEKGRRIFKKMRSVIRKMDNTRPVTCAVSFSPSASTIFDDVDVIGINYDFNACLDAHRRHPDKGVLFSEFCACATTRGWYDETDPTRGYVTAYDHHTDHYFVSRDTNYDFLQNNPFMMGGFAWNAFEYRGEATYPRLGSCSGLLDLYLQKKDAYYYTAALVSDKPVLHVMPHWNYDGLEGLPITVIAYTNAAQAQLFVNGKVWENAPINRGGYVQWDVPYVHGEIKVVATFEDGTTLTQSKCTTGAPVALKLTVEENAAAVGDVAIVTCSFLDENGQEVPTSANIVSFCCRGSGTIYATGADPSDHASPYLHDRKAFNGKITVAVKRTGNGPILLIARSDNLQSTYIQL